ncbi:MAG: hypothetical protein M3R26_02945 [Actinomycetota bacterium]|nr:hypothetical protein [Actinomycetota bacterium]
MQDLRLHLLAVGLGALALTFLALGLSARSGPALGWGIAALGGEYAVLFASQGRVLVEVTPAYAAAFIFVAEFGYWSIERRVAAWSEPGLLPRRLAYLAVTCAGAAAIAALVLVLAAASRGGGAALEAVGVAATIAALALLAVLVRRSVPEVDSRA